MKLSCHALAFPCTKYEKIHIRISTQLFTQNICTEEDTTIINPKLGYLMQSFLQLILQIFLKI